LSLPRPLGCARARMYGLPCCKKIRRKNRKKAHNVRSEDKKTGIIRPNMILATVFVVTSFLCFTNIKDVFAATLVVGDENALVPLSYTKYLDNCPVLFFTDQLEPKTISNLLGKVSIVLLANRQILDLLLDLVEPEHRFKMSNENHQISFTAKTNDTYEIWERNNSKVSILRSHLVKMLVDGKQIPEKKIRKRKTENQGQPWVKLGEVFLSKGEHTLSLFIDRDLVEELIIISHTEFEEYLTKVLNLIDKSKFELVYLFSRDEDKEQLLTRSFENPRELSYILKAYLVPSVTER